MAQFARERFGPEAVPDADSLVDEIVAFCAAGLETRSSRARRRSPRRRGR
jgi:hypothetical protein